MDNNNKWTEFYDAISQSVTDVRNDFKAEEITFIDKSAGIKVSQQFDEASLDNIRNAALAMAEDSKKNELSQKIDVLIAGIKERDAEIEQLKDDTNKNKGKWKEWYGKTRKDCEELCAKLENYTSDKLGILSLFADIMEVVVDKEGFYMEKAKTKVKGKILSRKRSSFWKVFINSTLLLVAMAVMAILFMMIGTDKVLFDTIPTDLGKWIGGGFILAFLVGTVFLVIRIVSLIKKSMNEIRQLQLLLDKMEIHKMTKHEIDRELERIQEAALK